jgi:phage replication-related protein YjqB (UPF0714/DUF867 family)
VRIERGGVGSGLYTVSQLRPESPDTVVRVGKDGRERLGTSAEFDGILDTRIARSELTDNEARDCGEFVERLQDNGSQTGLIVLAPHGGNIERHTDEQAERVAARLGERRASVWVCRGYRCGDLSAGRWHITSDDIEPRSFPALDAVFGRGFADAVSFHGFTHDGSENEIVVGGGADDLKAHVAAVLVRVVAGTPLTVRIAPPGDPLGGAAARNIVNRITADGRGGVQIEQGPLARDHYPLVIADAVAQAYRARLRRRGAGHPGTG